MRIPISPYAHEAQLVERNIEVILVVSSSLTLGNGCAGMVNRFCLGQNSENFVSSSLVYFY